ncbi:hypothetical protein C4E04_08610 [Microvirga sp. 17 mud 1-3]|nr:hypothetical protein C4E04_08610 [Microvirga sp. 17 mud 1-3]
MPSQRSCRGKILRGDPVVSNVLIPRCRTMGRVASHPPDGSADRHRSEFNVLVAPHDLGHHQGHACCVSQDAEGGQICQTFAVCHRLHTAKKPETRARRMELMLAQLERRARCDGCFACGPRTPDLSVWMMSATRRQPAEIERCTP